jgi:hypothetical protein
VQTTTGSMPCGGWPTIGRRLLPIKPRQYFAKALADKIGKRPRRSRHKSHAAALPEPPAARWWRRWRVRLEAALHKIAVAGKWLRAVWIVSIVALVLMNAFRSEAVRRQAGDIYLVRTLGLVAVVFAMMAIAGLLTFIAW